jgi:transcriptional regulator with XRE-family HTH domain
MELPRLRDWRLRRALAQRDLARLSGVGTATIARLERGYQRAQPNTARRLAEALRVDVDALQHDSGGRGSDEPGRQIAQDAAMRKEEV